MLLSVTWHLEFSGNSEHKNKFCNGSMAAGNKPAASSLFHALPVEDTRLFY